MINNIQSIYIIYSLDIAFKLTLTPLFTIFIKNKFI